MSTAAAADSGNPAGELFFVGTVRGGSIADPASTLPLGNVDLVAQCQLGPFYRRVVTETGVLPETFESHIAHIPGRKKAAVPVATDATADEPGSQGGLLELLLRPPQNEGVYMQNFDEDQLARAFRFHPGILYGYDASLLDQDDDDDDQDDDDDRRSSGDGQSSRAVHGAGGMDGANGASHSDKSHRSGSSLDKKHKKKASGQHGDGHRHTCTANGSTSTGTMPQPQPQPASSSAGATPKPSD
ncbi:hypothetical protein SYNPS1DRAFT_28798 [Syncephalis pseudoplumigaleata]|uniref:Uncharacterized protein n=1 Tax=Syncephalis pseudoplumigaleata TaxID=1712513 RepID=A0A4P9YZ75_9FUNG|nr:hypothetical protein SYNPS1DRAFT_28798 [Syncephalis pseudoplumigaleata]|eukprot:RKP25473.1 hypothetical protein SYNPS1DRAFT_28798 [Syncephalis pseudoplumigaleata]